MILFNNKADTNTSSSTIRGRLEPITTVATTNTSSSAARGSKEPTTTITATNKPLKISSTKGHRGIVKIVSSGIKDTDNLEITELYNNTEDYNSSYNEAKASDKSIFLFNSLLSISASIRVVLLLESATIIQGRTGKYYIITLLCT